MLVDAIKHGTTTLIDHHASPNAIPGSLDLIAEAADEAGLRAVLCYEVTDRDGEANPGPASMKMYASSGERQAVRLPAGAWRRLLACTPASPCQIRLWMPAARLFGRGRFSYSRGGTGSRPVRLPVEVRNADCRPLTKAMASWVHARSLPMRSTSTPANQPALRIGDMGHASGAFEHEIMP